MKFCTFRNWNCAQDFRENVVTNFCVQVRITLIATSKCVSTDINWQYSISFLFVTIQNKDEWKKWASLAARAIDALNEYLLCLVDKRTRVKLNRKLLWYHWCTMNGHCNNDEILFQCREPNSNNNGNLNNSTIRVEHFYTFLTCNGKFNFEIIFQHGLSYKPT